MFSGMEKALSSYSKDPVMSHPMHDPDFNPQQVKVHPDTRNPNVAWDKLKVKQKQQCLAPLALDTPVYPDKVRFVCVSDTHERTSKMKPLPPGDVLLHAGDFTMAGSLPAVEKFNDWLGRLPYKHKIVIAGNHDMTLDDELLNPSKKNLMRMRFNLDTDQVLHYFKQRGITHGGELLTNCTYLLDQETSVYGIRIWGSPWQPWFHDWGFNLVRGANCLDMWEKIPEGIDVLMTHGPPIGYGDCTQTGERAGCVELLNTIQKRVRPKYHVFGHIHEGYGIFSDGYTHYINASTCTLSYKADNNPIIFDFPLPPGINKDGPASSATKQISDPESASKF